jgi:hypothetical protein
VRAEAIGYQREETEIELARRRYPNQETGLISLLADLRGWEDELAVAGIPRRHTLYHGSVDARQRSEEEGEEVALGVLCVLFHALE